MKLVFKRRTSTTGRRNPINHTDVMQEMMDQDVEVNEPSNIPQKDQRTIEREQQDKEYQQACLG